MGQSEIKMGQNEGIMGQSKIKMDQNEGKNGSKLSGSLLYKFLTVQLDATPQMTKVRQIRSELIYRNRIENPLLYSKRFQV